MANTFLPRRALLARFGIAALGGFVGGAIVSEARAQQAGVAVESPQKRVKFTLLPSASRRLMYHVEVGGQAVIAPSVLGIVVDGQNLGMGASFEPPALRDFKETYLVTGVHATATNAYREAIFPVKSGAAQTPWLLEARVFDDGVALRYRVPLQGEHTVNGESTDWILPEGSVVWYQTDTSVYERPYLEQQIEQLPTSATVAAPLVAKLPRGLGYAFLTEANLVNYSDMSLKVGRGGAVTSHFANDTQGWKTEGEIVSPWRVTLLAPDLNALVNSDLLRNLCPPPAPELVNAAWIQPGRSSWHWMVTGRPQFSTQKEWVDRTQAVGFDYYLIDDGWVDWRDGDRDQWACIKDVVEYARPKNVKIWAWVHSKEVRTKEQRADYFAKAKAAGLVGLKIDFPERPNVSWVNWYDETLRDAAQAHLMVDFHGAVKPTGRERTWPNEMTREAILGRESGKLPASHDTALPFTRYVQGHADFTPTDFRPEKLNGSSWAHELAQAIVYTSPFLCYGGSPANYRQNPALDILQAIPPVWDETRVLPGSEIGRVAAFARRKGESWFVGVINGDDARPFPIRLDFLGDGAYRADLLADDKSNNAAWQRTQKTLTRRDSFTPDLRSDGGFVAHFTKTMP